jgi:hypothetical protein
MKVNNIKAFLFNQAEYRISDGESEVLLRVDYANNAFVIEEIGKNADRKLKTEITEIAQDLLKRKHGVNFAER